MKKTGGGSASLFEEDSFGFSQKQITGLQNPFDSDVVEDETLETVIEDSLIEETSEVSFIAIEPKHKLSMTPEPKKYTNKKMRMSVAKEDLIKSKAEGIDLDKKYKQLLIEKTELEKIKLELEIKNCKTNSNLKKTSCDLSIFEAYFSKKLNKSEKNRLKSEGYFYGQTEV